MGKAKDGKEKRKHVAEREEGEEETVAVEIAAKPTKKKAKKAKVKVEEPEVGIVEESTKKKRKHAEENEALGEEDDVLKAKRDKKARKAAKKAAKEAKLQATLATPGSAEEQGKAEEKQASKEGEGMNGEEVKETASEEDDALNARRDKKARKAAKKAAKEAKLQAALVTPGSAERLGKAEEKQASKNEQGEGVTLLLFYQYVEPEWTCAEHDEAIAFCKEAGEKRGMKGRIRVASEGLNSTITGPHDGVVKFCQDLRDWCPRWFKSTDFKLTPGLPSGQAFKELTVWPVAELVGYGLAHGKAPPLTGGGVHLPADEYHKKLEQPNVVVIDVRNAYESDIGRMNPPPGGATLLDPKMRRSTDFPGWLGDPKTKEQLEGKEVLMYCTGGVRCERASALLRQLEVKTEGVYQLQGGIDRYLKHFQDGGYWAGQNYTFDKRFAHGAPNAAKKREQGGESTTMGVCASCNVPWNMYRGKKKCGACGVPLLVCRECQKQKKDKQGKKLRCPLCVEQNIFKLKDKKGAATTDDKAEDRKLKRVASANGDEGVSIPPPAPAPAPAVPAGNPGKCTRLFIGDCPPASTCNLSFKIDEDSLKAAIPGITHIKWITDKETGKFYGSSFVEVATARDAGQAVAMAGQKLLGRPLKVNFAPARPGDVWPPVEEEEASMEALNNREQRSLSKKSMGELRERPSEDVAKIFVANIAHEANDEDVAEFFAGAEITKVRWLTHQDTGSFRGCGFIEFASPADTDVAVKMHGKELKGRPVKIDWAE
ncbi:unnamed protein product [Chrysoparadoxa australica]